MAIVVGSKVRLTHRFLVSTGQTGADSSEAKRTWKVLELSKSGELATVDQELHGWKDYFSEAELAKSPLLKMRRIAVKNLRKV